MAPSRDCLRPTYNLPLQNSDDPMTPRAFPVLLSLLLFVPAAPAAEPIDAKAVDAVVRDALESWKVPGAALAIVRGDEVVYMKGYGVCRTGTDEAVTPDTLFAIASCSK